MGIGRTVVAGIAGGVGMFVWASIAHIALPLATIGVQEITTNEPVLLSDLHTALGLNQGSTSFHLSAQNRATVPSRRQQP
jgi:hypothetical protein